MPISIFGAVDETRQKNYAYLSDKQQAGSKNSDHTISYLYQYVVFIYTKKLYIFTYLTNSLLDNSLPWWIRNLKIFLDNAGNIYNNSYIP